MGNKVFLKYILVISIFLFFAGELRSQKTEHFFQGDKLMLFGSYYYPEQWNESQWERDIKHIAGMGFDFTHFAEFASGHDAGHGEQGFRLASSYILGFNNDTYRNYPGQMYGVMELQPGQVNWGSFNPQPYPGAIRLWLYHVFAGGSKFVCNYRFRQPLKGSEQYHYGMIQTNGVSHSPGGEEYIQTIREMKILNAEKSRKTEMPEELKRRKTAILYGIDNDWEMLFQPQTSQWDAWQHLLRYYKPLKSFGTPVDIVNEGCDFTKYPVLIAPAYELLDRQCYIIKQGKALSLTSG